MTRTVLVTGFKPFPGMPINPTERLIARLPRRICSTGAVRFHFALLPTTWEGRQSVTDGLRRSVRPDAIIHFGADSTRRNINIETRAINQATRVKPDADGCHADKTGLQTKGPRFRLSTLPARALKAAAQRTGAKTALSINAGTYLCNATLWDSIGSGIPSIFVHVPSLPRGRRDARMPLTAIEAAALAILKETARRL